MSAPEGLRKRRSSSVSSISSIASTASSLITKSRALLHWDHLAQWRRDNHFIITGYRPDSNSFRESFLSLSYLHNESVNIWSHLLGAIAFLAGATFLYVAIRARYESASRPDVLVFACFFGGAVACLGMSATYHALSNHSEHVARWGNKLDYSGIVFLIVGSYVPALYYGLFCDPWLMAVYLYAICILGIGCGIVTWLEHFRKPEYRVWRTIMFVGLGTSGVVPIVHGLRIYGWDGLEERMSLSFVLLHGFFYIFGAFLYAARWPERVSPGTFDIWGSSHQWFHFFVVLAAVTHLYGMIKAFDHHHTVMGTQCP